MSNLALPGGIPSIPGVSSDQLAAMIAASGGSGGTDPTPAPTAGGTNPPATNPPATNTAVAPPATGAGSVTPAVDPNAIANQIINSSGGVGGGASGGSTGLSGLITDLLGGDQTNSQNTGISVNSQQTGTSSNSTTDQTQNSTQQTGTVNATSSTGQTNTYGTTTSLGPQAVQDLQTALDTASSQYSPADLSQIAGLLGQANSSALNLAQFAATRAEGADTTLAGSTNDIIAAAQSTMQQQLTAEKTQLAQGAGTSFNSVIQDAFARQTGLADVQLAGLAGQLLQQNRQQATQEIATALTDLTNVGTTILNTSGQIPALEAAIDATRTSSITNLAQALKGAVVTTDSSTTTAEQQSSETQSTVNQIQQTLGTTAADTTQNQNTTVLSLGTGASASNTTLTDLISALNGKSSTTGT